MNRESAARGWQRVMSACVLTAVLSVGTAAACDVAPVIRYAEPAAVKAFFERQGKRVVTFVGYSGAGYENRPAMLDEAGRMLDRWSPTDTIVNIGATPDGIGAVYDLAKQRGFTTAGIVSTQAKRYAAEISPCVDYVFYVEDDSWGGFVDGDTTLSPTSTAMVDASDVMVAIGGGAVARDELIAAKRAHKTVHFIAADMHHAKAIEKAQKKGLDEPTDFSGAAASAF